MHKNYAAWEWNWALSTWLQELGKTAADVTSDDLMAAISAWEAAQEQWTTWLLRDAEQEFRAASRISYGLGAGSSVDADFTAVRGAFEHNKFLASIRQETQEVAQRAEALRKRLSM
jgi:hypothetical protein